jgi:hypothetical protein
MNLSGYGSTAQNTCMNRSEICYRTSIANGRRWPDGGDGIRDSAATRPPHGFATLSYMTHSRNLPCFSFATRLLRIMFLFR